MAGKDLNIENLYNKTNSMYKLVVLASKRALELNVGAPKLVDTKIDNISLIALQEIAEGKITYKEAKQEKK